MLSHNNAVRVLTLNMFKANLTARVSPEKNNAHSLPKSKGCN